MSDTPTPDKTKPRILVVDDVSENLHILVGCLLYTSLSLSDRRRLVVSKA